MKTITDIRQMQNYADRCREEKKVIGFVPTMGYLHHGHLSLMEIIRPQCDVLVVSIFVNPTQFGPGEDLDTYPRDLKRDSDLCQKEGVDVIFHPSAQEMYQKPFYTFVTVEKLTEIMCGRSRPGHFRGVTTVVAKLFNIVKPHLAIFGEKDFQQLQVLRQMVNNLNYDIKILNAPIIREDDGLALSSRNKYLNSNERMDALVLYRSLQLAKDKFAQGERNAGVIKREMENLIKEIPSARIDYIEIVNLETFEPVDFLSNDTFIALAVYIGQTRLIDNIVLKKVEVI